MSPSDRSWLVVNTLHYRAVEVDPHTASLQYYPDGMLNVAENCIDRHLAENADKVPRDV